MTLSTRSISDVVPTFRMRWVTEMDRRIDFWRGFAPSMPNMDGLPFFLLFFLPPSESSAFSPRILRRMSDEGKLAVAINVQSPSNISLSCPSSPIDDVVRDSKSLTAFWSSILSAGRAMNLPDGELSASDLDRANSRLRASRIDSGLVPESSLVSSVASDGISSTIDAEDATREVVWVASCWGTNANDGVAARPAETPHAS
mmetsp:Transcript_4030/g.10216  ORF Transcript_4030/g.10216 Transcript_4030/m.10216 type:complete len:201 (-) Transcript_4030:307-909(-)